MSMIRANTQMLPLSAHSVASWQGLGLTPNLLVSSPAKDSAPVLGGDPVLGSWHHPQPVLARDDFAIYPHVPASLRMPDMVPSIEQPATTPTDDVLPYEAIPYAAMFPLLPPNIEQLFNPEILSVLAAAGVGQVVAAFLATLIVSSTLRDLREWHYIRQNHSDENSSVYSRALWASTLPVVGGMTFATVLASVNVDSLVPLVIGMVATAAIMATFGLGAGIAQKFAMTKQVGADAIKDSENPDEFFDTDVMGDISEYIGRGFDIDTFWFRSSGWQDKGYQLKVHTLIKHIQNYPLQFQLWRKKLMNRLFDTTNKSVSREFLAHALRYNNYLMHKMDSSPLSVMKKVVPLLYDDVEPVRTVIQQLHREGLEQLDETEKGEFLDGMLAEVRKYSANDEIPARTAELDPGIAKLAGKVRRRRLQRLTDALVTYLKYLDEEQVKRALQEIALHVPAAWIDDKFRVRVKSVINGSFGDDFEVDTYLLNLGEQSLFDTEALNQLPPLQFREQLDVILIHRAQSKAKDSLLKAFTRALPSLKKEYQAMAMVVFAEKFYLYTRADMMQTLVYLHMKSDGDQGFFFNGNSAEFVDFNDNPLPQKTLKDLGLLSGEVIDPFLVNSGVFQAQPLEDQKEYIKNMFPRSWDEQNVGQLEEILSTLCNTAKRLEALKDVLVVQSIRTALKEGRAHADPEVVRLCTDADQFFKSLIGQRLEGDTPVSRLRKESPTSDDAPGSRAAAHLAGQGALEGREPK